MIMHNPPHPGEFIIQVYLEPNQLKVVDAVNEGNRIVRGSRD